MSKIGIIGDTQSVTGFLSLGIDVFIAEDADTIKKTLKALADNGYSIIYITEKASLVAEDLIARYKDDPLPAIIVIPGIDGNLGIGMKEIRDSAKRAIGADILFNEN
ncbi:MAG: V-type ATP synthase subunit F [Lachnospiraceae bacterium]|nr:V-type ATP synthase subunit F [Lachnospiraceae bacterium]